MQVAEDFKGMVMMWLLW